MKVPELFPRLTAHACAALLLLSLAPPAPAQRRRQPAPRPKPAAPAPAATQTPARPAAQPARRPEPDLSFEEMLVADGYTVYAEVRRAGALSQVEEVKSAVASLRLVGGEEVKPLTDFYDFVSANAEALGESRLVFTFMPARAALPQALFAVELESPEAAAAFEPKFRRLLGEQVRQVRQAVETQPAPPAAAAKPTREGERKAGAKPAAADFGLRRAGRWLIAAEAPFTLKRLRGEEGEPRLADSTRFQTVRSRFANDSLFVYVDTDVAQQGWALQMQRAAEAQSPDPTQTTAVTVGVGTGGLRVETGDDAPPSTVPPETTPETAGTPEGPTPEAGGDDVTPEGAEIVAKGEGGEAEKDAPPPPPPTKEELAVRGLGGVLGNLWGGVPRIPGAVAFGASLDRGALALRLAVENTPDGTIALIPFMPNLVSGPPITAEAAAVAPADAELFVSGSLDWTHVYNSTLGAAALSPAALVGAFGDDGARPEGKEEKALTADEAIAAAEKVFGFKFKEELLPSLGNEVAVSMPLDASYFGMGRPRPAGEEKEERDAEPGLLFIVSMNDPAKMRAVLPRVLAALGFVSLAELSRPPERRAGYEIRPAGSVSYAFINNFLVVGELTAVRHCVDSFESRRTLAASNAYRDTTAWQSKQKLVQIFVSDALVKSAVEDTRKRSGGSTDAAVRALLAQLETAEFAPASYEATNEGDVVLHEVRLPLSLVRSYALAAAVSAKDAPVIVNETMAFYALNRIAAAQSTYKDDRKKGRYGTLEELLAEKLLENGFLENMEYKIELSAAADKFEVSATPKTYGKSGRRSFFLDETGKVRAADHKGRPATAADPETEQ